MKRLFKKKNEMQKGNNDRPTPLANAIAARIDHTLLTSYSLPLQLLDARRHPLATTTKHLSPITHTHLYPHQNRRQKCLFRYLLSSQLRRSWTTTYFSLILAPIGPYTVSPLAQLLLAVALSLSLSLAITPALSLCFSKRFLAKDLSLSLSLLAQKEPLLLTFGNT